MIDNDDDDYVLEAKDSYRDNPLLKKVGIKVEWTKQTIEEYKKTSQRVWTKSRGKRG